nr:hypothetical protein [Tanacetum cinerariifolium]
QFCNSDLEVAFRQHTCFIRNLEGVNLLTGSRGNNLYTLSLQDIMASSPICLLFKASKTKSWLWHHRLSHLNFGAMNHLARQGLVRGLQKLKFEKDHLCSACAMGKSTKKSHKPKSEDTNQEKLYLLHMDLCGPMRVESASKTKSWHWHRRLSHLNFGAINHLARQGLVRGLSKLKFEKDHLCSACAMGKSTKKTHKPKSEDTKQEKLYLLHMDLCGPIRVESVNGKKYILVIVDDYSRFTWVKFLRSKDETPMFIIKFLKMIQQNEVIERRNRILIEAARTMLIYAQAPLFLWAEAVATACFTQNRSIIRLRHGKTPENVDKLQPKADIGIFIGYAPTKKAFRIYNRRTKRIVKTIHVDFDELTAMASEQSSLGPALQEMTPGTISSGLVVDNQAAEVIAPIAEVIPQVDDDSTGSPSSTTVDQDAPSPSKSLTPIEIQSSVIPQDVGNDNLDIEVAHMGNDPLLGVPILEVTSEQSSSMASPQSNVQPNHPMTHHNSKWTKDHPLNYIIGPLSRLVSTRLQLHEQALFCYYDAFLTSVEPKTYKEALTQACWIEAMQEELHEFERLEVWELVPRPDKVMVITLKWIYKVKLDELGGILKNKARLVTRGYRQEERIHFEESFSGTFDFSNNDYNSLTRKRVIV